MCGALKSVCVCVWPRNYSHLSYTFIGSCALVTHDLVSRKSRAHVLLVLHRLGAADQEQQRLLVVDQILKESATTLQKGEGPSFARMFPDGGHIAAEST
jgi:hypothetical protein